ncbi:DNA mismatch repair protein mutS [Candidatus Vecturithrix granuli]|uniref:DNA mismatch repair protein MutS n=1 Tax=Vecturithrix granuli TaxID=1499967 RepID=A0A081BXP9_VECG1|nr:DNA mismatch repair protein mutS [Candidatus Vecturithrix granuli]
MPEPTPMIKQYLRIKAEYPDTLLFFRMGDFYEMFYQDAEIASKALQITLTSRKTTKQGEDVPLCGVPYHAVDTYLARLIKQGFRVAICEQVEDPKHATGIVKREVVRVVTPGTVLDTSVLEAKENNFIAAIISSAPDHQKKSDARAQIIGLAVLDLSTGEFSLGEFSGAQRFQKLLDELQRFEPKEILIPESHEQAATLAERRVMEAYNTACLTTFSDMAFQYRTAKKVLLDHFQVYSLAGFGCQDTPHGVSAAGALLQYIQTTQKTALPHIRKLSILRSENFMLIDYATQRNLELYKTIADHARSGSLLGLLDKTMTSMGGRMLQKWMRYPLVNVLEIHERLEAVEELKDDIILRGDLREQLRGIHDLERLITRLTLSAANARDLVALKLSLFRIPELRTLLKSARSPLITRLVQACDELQDVAQLISHAIEDEPPVTLRDGKLIRAGYNEELDELRTISREGKTWIASLERKERQRTKINSLKIKYNKVFGYFLEITRPNLHLVPDDYIIKQTLVNAVRYITPELKEYEEKVLGAEDKILELEYALFQEIRQAVAQEVDRVMRTAENIAILDVLAALAEVADHNRYVKPEVNANDCIEITEGRHPVIEQMKLGEPFIPNDTLLDCQENQFLIITGPNMAGKSTYIRQVALITLMAQLGSFVPAKKAMIGVVDRIFTRIGASDNLSRGESTFMVEMNETANILNNATRKSLLILDEIGRGTSTFDGMSIAWAVAEYICQQETIGARTLFATHYHELTELASMLSGVKNYNVAVREWQDQVIFLRKIVEGGADQSYGIHVAKLAGLPLAVIQRAQEILQELEQTKLHEHGAFTPRTDAKFDLPPSKKPARRIRSRLSSQLSLFGEPPIHPVIEILQALDVNALTPLEALNLLHKFQQDVR